MVLQVLKRASPRPTATPAVGRSALALTLEHSTTTTAGPATTTRTPARPAISLGTVLRTGAVARVLVAVGKVVISAIARGPLGASDDFAPLTPGPIILWTILGAAIGAAGWRLIVNKKVNSGALLDKLVPTVLVLSLIPDMALLATDSLPAQTTAGVLALMVMHVLTAVIVVTAYRRSMPAT